MSETQQQNDDQAKKQPATRLPAKERLLALARDKNTTKSDASEITGEHGDRVKAFLESGNGDRDALNFVAKLLKKGEQAARRLIDHMRFACEVVEDELDKKGHHGDLVTNAEAAALADEEGEGDGEGDGAGEEGSAGGEGTTDPAGINAAMDEATADLEARRAEQTATELAEADAEEAKAAEAKAGRKGRGKAAPTGPEAINSIATATAH